MLILPLHAKARVFEPLKNGGDVRADFDRFAFLIDGHAHGLSAPYQLDGERGLEDANWF
jgi:hypothetical protein